MVIPTVFLTVTYKLPITAVFYRGNFTEKSILFMHQFNFCFLKKNLNAPRPSEHPPVWGKILFTFVSRPVDLTRPDQHFFPYWKRPGGAFCPIFAFKNVPEALFQNILRNAPGGVYSVLYGIAFATQETTLTQRVSHRPIKCQSRSWSQRGTKVNGSHDGDIPLPKPRGIGIATKSLSGPTNREHRKLIRVKTMSLGTNYSFYCQESRRA